MNTALRIAIIGAGPAGLTLARILHVHGVACTVFERDSHPMDRPQGGTLDLHENSGLLALAHAGLRDAFSQIARYEDQGTRLVDKHANLLFEAVGAASDNRPEVDRTALRTMLLDALPAGVVQWGHTLREAQKNHGDNRWTLQFAHGSEGPFDLVVGADGAGSRVRSLLSPYIPQYSGLCFLEFGIDDVDDTHPHIAQLVGRGKLSVEADGKAIIVQRNANAHLRGYAIFRVPLGWVEKRFDLASPAAVRDGLVQEFSGFAEEIRDMFRVSNDQFAVRPIRALPIGHCWAHRLGLTLLGDAAHVMSPFGGDGVNNAMLDAAELARLLVQFASWDEAVDEYERGMFTRVLESADGAAEGAATFLSHDGQALTLALYQSHAATSTVVNK